MNFLAKTTLFGGIAAIGLTVGIGMGSAQTNAAWDEVVAKGKQEGVVNLYSSTVPQQAERLIAAFNAKYPEIRINHVRGAGELPPRVAAERAAGGDGADVFMYSDALWYSENEQYTIELNSPEAANFPDSGWQVKNKSPFIGFPPFGFLAWNTEKVKDGLTSFQDLLKPELKGHVATREGMTATYAGYMDFLEKELGPDWLKAFGAQQLKFYPSSVPLSQSLASGEVWASNVAAIGTLRDLKDQGAPVAWATPEPFGFANPWNAAVMSSSKRPNAARVFVDFAISKEGQEAFNGDDSASPRPDVKGEVDLAKYKVLRSEDFPKETRDAWQKKFEEYFRR